MDKVKRIKELVSHLNIYRNAYYNNSESQISDYEYDNLFDELKQLERNGVDRYRRGEERKGRETKRKSKQEKARRRS